MKKYLLAILMLPAVASFSQTKNLLSVSAGPSIPIGGFGKSNLDDPNAGFARTGPDIQISFDHFFTKSFSASVNFFGNSNPVNTAALEEQYGNNFYAAPFSSYTSKFFQQWQFDKKSWMTYGAMLGISNTFLLKNSSRFFFKLKSEAGLLLVKSPALNGKSSTDTSAASLTLTKGSGKGFVYAFSAGMAYKVNQKICLQFSIQYTGSNEIKLGDLTQTFTATMRAGTPGLPAAWQYMRTTPGTQTISSCMPVLGIGISF